MSKAVEDTSPDQGSRATDRGAAAGDGEEMDRRAMLRTRGLAAVSAALLAACSKSASFGGKTRAGQNVRKDSGDNSVPGPGNDSNASPADNTANPTEEVANATDEKKTVVDDAVADKCNPLNNDAIDLSKIPDAPAALQPSMKFYGTNKNAMVVIDYDKYTVSDAMRLTKVILTRPNGKIISVRVLTEADNAPMGRLWSLVHDYINLKDSTKLVVVAVLADDSYHKFSMPDAIGFEDSFQNKEVMHLGDVDSMPANFFKFQAIPNFKDTGTLKSDGSKEGFLPAPADKYIFSMGRKLYTAQVGVKYTPAAGLSNRDFVITDLMGRELAKGKDFNNIIDYPCFIAYLRVKRSGMTYVPAAEGESFEKWVRTIVKVG